MTITARISTVQLAGVVVDDRVCSFGNAKSGISDVFSALPKSWFLAKNSFC